jgi:hypothetical protein
MGVAKLEDRIIVAQAAHLKQDYQYQAKREISYNPSLKAPTQVF